MQYNRSRNGADVPNNNAVSSFPQATSVTLFWPLILQQSMRVGLLRSIVSPSASSPNAFCPAHQIPHLPPKLTRVKALVVSVLSESTHLTETVDTWKLGSIPFIIVAGRNAVHRNQNIWIAVQKYRRPRNPKFVGPSRFGDRSFFRSFLPSDLWWQ